MLFNLESDGFLVVGRINDWLEGIFPGDVGAFVQYKAFNRRVAKDAQS
jgi:hypothetical protein